MRYFVSFSRRDGRLKDDFLGRLADLFGSAKKYRFVEWQDKHIEVGSLWHEQIQSAIAGSDFGLLLVSPAFLANEYIITHELPQFLSLDPQRSGKKLIVPVALKALRFDGTMDLKGLEERQIFRDQNRRAYGQLTGSQKRDEFVNTLFEKIIELIASSSPMTSQTGAREGLLEHVLGEPAGAPVALQQAPEHRRPSLQQEPSEVKPDATDLPAPVVAEAMIGQDAAAGIAESDIQSFLGKDPVAGDAVIARLAAHGPEILDILLEKADTSRQVTIRLRKLCALLGATAVPYLLNAIRDGSRNAKSNAAPCFAAFQGDPIAKKGLYDLLKGGDFDIQRLAIEAVGHINYDLQWELQNLAKFGSMYREGILISKYSFDKLYTYVIEAAARLFANNGNRATLESLMEFSLLSAEQTRNWFGVESSIERGFEDLTPATSDNLIKEWLRHTDRHFRIHALGGLARLRLQRTLPAIASVLFDLSEDSDVRLQAGIALGAFSSAAAAQSLADLLNQHPGGPGIIWAFSILYAQPIEWPECSHQIAAALSSDDEVRQQMLLSLGWRGGVSYRSVIEKGLSEQDEYVRGTSALALAHLLGPGALEALHDLADEAANEWERVFMLAAQIHAGMSGRGDALHAALQQFKLLQLLRPVWSREILSALALADGNTRRAALWAEIAGERLDRILAEVNKLRAFTDI